MSIKLNEKQKQELFDKCNYVKNYQNNPSKWTDLNEEMGFPFVDGERLRCWFKAEAKRKIEKGEIKRTEIYPDVGEDGFVEPTRPYPDTIELNADGSQSSSRLIEISKEDCKDVNKILKLHGYDTNVWEVVKVSNSIWNSPAKNSSRLELYASKIIVKPRVGVSAQQIEDMFNNIKTRAIPCDKMLRYNANGKVLEIALTDFHFGMLAWGEETGTDYNLEIATKKFRDIIQDIIRKTSTFNFSKIYFVFCHDFFHCNNQQGTTNKGTQVETSGRMFEIFNRGVELLVEAIETLKQIAPVETVWLHSNHSADTSYYAVKCLEAYYRNDNNVIIDTKSTPRKYRKFGKCLLGMAHGDNEGKRANVIMQTEEPQLFGETKFREMHLGHQHHEKVEDINGVVIRYLPSPAPADRWHTELGFLGAQRKIQSFVWDAEKGVEFIIQTMVEY